MCRQRPPRPIQYRPAFHPHLEEIETRLLPGEAVGLGLVASFNLFDSLVAFPAVFKHAWAEPSGVATQADSSLVLRVRVSPTLSRAASEGTPGGTELDRNLPSANSGSVSPVTVSASRNKEAVPLDASASDTIFATLLSSDLTNDLTNASSLFASASPSKHFAAAHALSHSRSITADFALAPLEGSGGASTAAAVPSENASNHAGLAIPTSAGVGLAGSGGSVRSGPIVPHDQGPSWSSYAHDPQHTAISDVPAQPLTGILWQTPVDLDPQSSGGELLIHYGSPLVTQANTVIVPVKTGATDGFEVDGFDGSTGALKWRVTTDYSVPDSTWTPPMSVVLTGANRLYIPGAGGTVYYMDDPDADNATISGQLAFYGISNYDHSYDSNVKISTPLTADSQGNIYFGFTVYGPTALNLQSGIARMDPNGNGSWVSASAAAGDSSISQVLLNCAPALSNDESSLYIAVSTGSGFGTGYLLRLDSQTLATTGEVYLLDPASGQPAFLPDVGTASPTVGPDGDVYFGVLENPLGSNHDRGWLLHFSGDLTQSKIPGAFGWDDTASVVPASMVPSYTGSSPYLLMTKYNNYKDLGGDGVNKLAVLDPNSMMDDPVTGACVMQEVLTIAGVTPDPTLPMVREWCINTAAVDPATDSIFANSEDGTLYRWNLASNSFTESVNLTVGTGEAYTPTVIGVDGTVYAINDATLFAVV
jgi:hypothetical protein